MNKNIEQSDWAWRVYSPCYNWLRSKLETVCVYAETKTSQLTYTAEVNWKSWLEQDLNSHLRVNFFKSRSTFFSWLRQCRLLVKFSFYAETWASPEGGTSLVIRLDLGRWHDNFPVKTPFGDLAYLLGRAFERVRGSSECPYFQIVPVVWGRDWYQPVQGLEVSSH